MKTVLDMHVTGAVSLSRCPRIRRAQVQVRDLPRKDKLKASRRPMLHVDRSTVTFHSNLMQRKESIRVVLPAQCSSASGSDCPLLA